MNQRTFGIGLELAVLFVIVPTGVALAADLVPGLPVLWAATAYCVWVLRRDRCFNRETALSCNGLRSAVPGILASFSVAAAGAYSLVRLWLPDSLFDLPTSGLLTWVAVLLLYSTLSVVPQTIVFRVFFFHRYRLLFPTDRALVIAGALLFAYVHIVFRNPVAVIATIPAGLLFGMRYLRTRSAAVSVLDHALHGGVIFTVGLGRYFGQSSLF